METIRGVVRGKMIELEQELGYLDGQEVTIVVQSALSPEECLRQAFGAWADESAELDEYMEEVRQSRKRTRPELS